MASKAKIAIINSFLKLVENEDFEKITVTALVEECNISRQTFYYHFDDINEMLKWSFDKDTSTICQQQVSGKWIDSAKLYVEVLNKYDTLIRKAARSNEFIFIYNLIYNSFSTYIKSYLELRHNEIGEAGGFDYLISFLASSFCGLVILEIQKENSNYNALLNIISNGFKVLPK